MTKALDGPGTRGCAGASQHPDGRLTDHDLTGGYGPGTIRPTGDAADVYDQLRAGAAMIRVMFEHGEVWAEWPATGSGATT